MYSLIWQSVMWRPGKLWFLTGMKNLLPYPAGCDARKTAPRGAALSPDSRLESGYALLSSRIWRCYILILIDALFSSCLSRGKRYLRVSTIITTNLDLPAWYDLFRKKELVDALLDRLRHRCIIIRINGPSLRAPSSEPDTPSPSDTTPTGLKPRRSRAPK